MNITTLPQTNRLQVSGMVLEGSTRQVEQLTPEFVKLALGMIQGFAIPKFDVVLLPFALDKIDGDFVMAEGAYDHPTNTIYMGAVDLVGWANPYAAMDNKLKTFVHEVGHAVHYAYIDLPYWGRPPVGLWNEFETVLGREYAYNSYMTALHEVFAETWRMLFAPQTRWIEHRHKIDWEREGIKEWMLSLPGNVVLRPGHKNAYKGGQIIRLDVAPVISFGRTMVPLRAVGELVDKNVHWDGERILIS